MKVTVKIKWLGHSCFLVTSSEGVKILTDPFDEQVGYEVPSEEADIVTTSHDHYDHNYIKAVKGNFVHIKEPGTYSEHGIDIKGVATFHDEAGGKKRGKNVVYKFNVDGIEVCHCGDLGHIPAPGQVEEIGRVDVLLLPVGGNYTVDAKEAFEVAKLLKPAVIIPMHFKTDDNDFPIDGVDKFVAVAGGGERAGKQEVEFTRENIGSMPPVLILEYKG